MDQKHMITSDFHLPQHTVDIAAKILTWIHYSSAAFVLTFFLIVFVIRSVYASTPTNSNSNNEEPSQPVYGPGGKPLPQRRLTGLKRKQDKQNDFPTARKLAFQVLTALSCATFVASAAVVIIHFLADRSFWCGEAFVVSIHVPHPAKTFLNQLGLRRRQLLCLLGTHVICH
jgi:hypothetical protein